MLEKKLTIWAENAAIYTEKMILTLAFKEIANFLPKIGKNHRKL
jgi:hypothetical protein